MNVLLINQQDDYWERHYSNGRGSGDGSVGDHLRTFKWECLEAGNTDLQNVIDVGCGDLSFWDGRQCRKYLGIEKSTNRCIINAVNRPDLRCTNHNAEDRIDNIHAPTVLCFDMLFHVMNPEAYIRILKNLAEYSTDKIFIYTLHTNPFLYPTIRWTAILSQIHKGNYHNAWQMAREKEVVTDFEYQYYRDFETLSCYLDGFQCQDMIRAEQIDPFGAMYVFRRIK